MHQWSKLEELFFKRYTRQLRDAAIEELLREVYSVRSVPRFFMQDKSRYKLAVRESPASIGVNREVQEATALEAVTRQRLAKIQQTEKT
jgi:hypothetical protein